MHGTHCYTVQEFQENAESCAANDSPNPCLMKSCYDHPTFPLESMQAPEWRKKNSVLFKSYAQTLIQCLTFDLDLADVTPRHTYFRWYLSIWCKSPDLAPPFTTFQWGSKNSWYLIPIFRFCQKPKLVIYNRNYALVLYWFPATGKSVGKSVYRLSSINKNQHIFRQSSCAGPINWTNECIPNRDDRP